MICCEAGLAKAKALLVLSRREVSSSVLKRRELGVVTFRGGIFRGARDESGFKRKKEWDPGYDGN